MKNSKAQLNKFYFIVGVVLVASLIGCTSNFTRYKRPFTIHSAALAFNEPISFYKSKGNWYLAFKSFDFLQTYKSSDLITWETDSKIKLSNTWKFVRAFSLSDDDSLVIAGWDTSDKKLFFNKLYKSEYREISFLSAKSLSSWTLDYSQHDKKYTVSVKEDNSHTLYFSDNLINWQKVMLDSASISFLKVDSARINSFTTYQVNNSQETRWVIQIEENSKTYWNLLGNLIDNEFQSTAVNKMNSTCIAIQAINTDDVDPRQLGIPDIKDSVGTKFLSPIVDLSLRVNDLTKIISGYPVDQTKSLRKVAYELNKVVVNGHMDLNLFTSQNKNGLEGELLITRIDQSKSWNISLSNQKGDELRFGFNEADNFLFLKFKNHWNDITHEESERIKDNETQTPFSFIITEHHAVLYHFTSGISLTIPLPVTEPLVFGAFYSPNGALVAEGNIFIY